MHRLWKRASFANVMSATAVFIALGGTSYAVTALPRDSVGAKQIRADAVGASELRKSAVRSAQIKQRSIRLDDVSRSARRALTGQTGPAGPAGPPGVPFSAAVNAGGSVRSATAVPQASHSVSGSGDYGVVFNRDMTSCFAVATLVGSTSGEISTETTTQGVIVRTRTSGGAPVDRPFHLLVSC